MAGMEQLEIHSRDYLVRWVNVVGGHTISWSLQPRKKTINFGVFRRVSTCTEQSNEPSTSMTTLEQVSTHDSSADPKSKRHTSTTNHPDSYTSSVIEKLQRLGMRPVVWTGRCEADRVTMGQYEVPEDGDGMYGMVFDNTYSKQFSKTVTFVQMTYPSNAPPKSGHHMQIAQAMGGNANGGARGKQSPKIRARSESNGSLDADANRVVLADPRPRSSHATESVKSLGGSFYTGMLSKKRRKRNQGYARRFFSLDFTSSTLSYYKNRNSSALRGAIPLSLAVVGANDKLRQISVDSGAEIWLLKASTQQDFNGWLDALQRAAQTDQDPQTRSFKNAVGGPGVAQNPAEEREWKHVEGLVGRVAGITDAMRRLAKDTDPKYMPGHRDANGSDPTSPADAIESDYFSGDQRPDRPFWRRKSTNQSRTRTPNFRRNPSGQRLAPPSPDPSGSFEALKRQTSLPTSASHNEHNVHDHCMQVLRDLDAVVTSFSSLIQQSRQRRAPSQPEPASRNSLDSVDGQDFYDAKEDRDDTNSLFFDIGRDQHDDSPEQARDDDVVSIDSTSTVSNAEVGEGGPIQSELFPGRPQSLYPLPHGPVSRRNNINAAKGTPPSLISFLRKNVGKDLSTIAMPVTANEPLSLLQRSAENLEHAQLLSTAAKLMDQKPEAQTKRLLLVAAFAISPLANTRAKERAVRKPFNPMLGETYELVREDLGFRFIGEKVSHRPVRVAFQAEGGPSSSKVAAWTYAQAPAPSQKFWGKSAELLTEGRARVWLHETNECYSWTPPQCFLRNIIAGEKYMEPVGNMTVTEEISGRRAVITFKTGGMFSGRSEDVTVETLDASQQLLPLGLKGKWTTSLVLTGASSGEEVIWEAGDLDSGAPTRYGMTQFAMGLNEMTEMEKGKLPPTDSRLRPDQRAYEEGDVDRAEELKHKLEEGQRRRRAKMEGEGKSWEPKWFKQVQVEGQAEGIWKLREEGGYWASREAAVRSGVGGWEDVGPVFEA